MLDIVYGNFGHIKHYDYLEFIVLTYFIKPILTIIGPLLVMKRAPAASDVAEIYSGGMLCAGQQEDFADRRTAS